MLVISRREDEAVVIYHDGREIGRVQACRSVNGKVRIGFEFDKSYKILREELSLDADDGGAHGDS